MMGNMADSVLHPGDILEDRYIIKKRIAQGGMATIYLATDTRLSRRVAIKVLHSHLAQGTYREQFLHRFGEEARSAAAIANPHIVQVYDTGVTGDLCYLVMEYVPGTDLRRQLKKQDTFSVRETLEILTEILDGLSSAAQAGLIHRDIKPENILINERNRIEIADFGLAKTVTAVTGGTATGLFLGTAAYLAPETIEKEISTPQSDLYSVGIVAFEMLTGSLPFDSSNPVTQIFKTVQSDVPSLLSVDSHFPPEMAAFINKLTARDSEARPQSAQQALDIAQSLLETLPTSELDYRYIPKKSSLDSLLQDKKTTDPLSDKNENSSVLPTQIMNPSMTSEKLEDPLEDILLSPDKVSDKKLKGSSSVRSTKNTSSSSTPENEFLSSNETPIKSPFIDSDFTDTELSRSLPTTLLSSKEKMQALDQDNQGKSKGFLNLLSSRKETSSKSDDTKASKDTDNNDFSAEKIVSIPPRRRRTALWASLASLGVLLIGITIFLLWWFLLGPASYRIIPGPQGQSCQVGTVNCTLQKFKWSTYEAYLKKDHIPFNVTYQHSDNIPAGDIITTTPQAGAHLHKNKILEVIVSNGPKYEVLPVSLSDCNLYPNPADELKQLGFLSVQTKNAYSLQVSQGCLVSSSVELGKKITVNTPITLTISQGLKPVTLPQLQGVQQAQALQQLQALHLNTQVQSTFSDSVPQGAIISTSPAGGAQLHWKDNVSLTVSKGPQMVTMPNVVGKSAAEATTILQQLGFKVVTQASPIGDLLHRVFKQSVPAGSQVRLRDTSGKPTVITLTLV